MTKATKNLTEKYDDIELCYKVMGLSFSDSPDKVDRVYNSLIAEYTSNMKSADPAVRQAANANLQQVKDLYARITGSTIYKDYAREYEKYKQLKAEEMQARKQKLEDASDVMTICPNCSRQIPAKQKVCIYCQGKMAAPMELLLQKVFSKRNIVIMAVVLFVVAVGVVIMMNPLIGANVVK